MRRKIWNTNFISLGTWALSEPTEIKSPIPQLPWLQQFLFFFFFWIPISSSDSVKKEPAALRGDSLSTPTRALSGVGSLQRRLASGDAFTRKNRRVTRLMKGWCTFHQPSDVTLPLTGCPAPAQRCKKANKPIFLYNWYKTSWQIRTQSASSR